jgi:hypothetical protein
MNDSRKHKQELVETAAPYWAGEAEIVETYLDGPRTVESDLYFLKAQAWKETRHLRVLPSEKQREFWETGTVAEHPGGPDSARKLSEEMQHFDLLCEIIRDLLGRPVTLDDLTELPEETRLQALREPYRRRSDLDRAIVDFTEGGGGAIYAVLARLDGSSFNRKIATAFAKILSDELIHGPGQIHTIAHLADSSADWEHAKAVVPRINLQRLYMRNEMFGFPLTSERIAEIADGKIDRWEVPVRIG